MPALASLAFCAILAGLTAFQITLILGAPIGRFAWGGQHTVLPTGLRVGSGISILLYAAFAIIALDRVRLVDAIPGEAFAQVAMWVMVAYFALGIIMNAISRSRPERWTMVPVCTALAALSLLMASA